MVYAVVALGSDLGRSSYGVCSCGPSVRAWAEVVMAYVVVAPRFGLGVTMPDRRIQKVAPTWYDTSQRRISHNTDMLQQQRQPQKTNML